MCANQVESIAFFCEQNHCDLSLPVLDCEVNIHNDITGCTVDILYNSPVNQQKLAQLQAEKVHKAVAIKDKQPVSSSQTSLVNTNTTTVPGSHSTYSPQDLSTFPGGASGSDPLIPPHKSPSPNNSNSSS